MLLPGLGTGTSYQHDNPYSEDTSERLAERIRAAHDVCCINGNPLDERRPISITHNLGTGKIVARFRPFLSKDSIAFLSAVTKDVGESVQDDVLAEVRALVELETSRPVFDLGFKDLGNGMMGRVPTTAPWPDLRGVSFAKFLELMSQDQREDCPAHLMMLDKFSAIMLHIAGWLCAKVVAQARQSNPDLYAKAGRELGCKSQRPNTATFCKALAASDDRNLVFDALWTMWHKRLEKLNLGEILGIRPVK